MGDALPAVNLGAGRTALAIAAGSVGTCVVLDDNTVKCFGNAMDGTLGSGDGGAVSGELIAPVDLGTGRSATSIAVDAHRCATLDNGATKCWGYNNAGQLGVGDTVAYHDKPNQMGNALPAIDLGTGRSAKAIVARHQHTCALLDNDRIKCWGDNGRGELGLGDTANRGDAPNEMGDALPYVDLGSQ